MYKIEAVNKSHTIRLLPNFHDVQQPTITIEGAFVKPNKLPNPHRKHLCYILNDGKIITFEFNKAIFDYIQKCMMGFYGTSEGYYIASLYDKKPKKYFSFDERETIFIKKDDCKDSRGERTDKIIKYKDIIEYKPLDLFNPNNEYSITFETIIKTFQFNGISRDFYQMSKIGLVVTGSFTPVVLSPLYDGVRKLEETRDDILTDMQEKDPNFVTDKEEIKKSYDAFKLNKV